MAAPVILVEAQPRRADNGQTVRLRLAGGGAVKPYYYQGEHWMGGIQSLPTIIASLEFEGADFGNGSVPSAALLEWSGPTKADLAQLAGYVWKRAAITVRIGPEGALPPIVLQGRVLEATAAQGVLRIALSDPAEELKQPLLTQRFAGTGDLEGPPEFEGLIRKRVFGRVWNVPGDPIDPPNNIYCFSDPLRPLQAIDALRDKGASAAAMTLVGWQGSTAATLAALRAANAPEGGGVRCPSIACVKWWTQPDGDLTADLRGETGAGYVNTAASIAERLVQAIGGPAFAPGTVAAANAVRGAELGWAALDDTTTVAAMLDQLLGNVSLLWVLSPTGAITLKEWKWGAPVASAEAITVSRTKTISPLATRKIGYQRNELPMTRSSLAAIVLYSGVEGTPTQLADINADEATRLPDQPGADRTADNAAAGVTGGGPFIYAGDLIGGDPVAGAKLDDIEGGATFGDGFIKNGALLTDTQHWTFQGAVSREVIGGKPFFKMAQGTRAYVNEFKSFPQSGGKSFIEAEGFYDGNRTVPIVTLYAYAYDANGAFTAVALNKVPDTGWLQSGSPQPVKWDLDIPDGTVLMRYFFQGVVSGGTNGHVYIGNISGTRVKNGATRNTGALADKDSIDPGSADLDGVVPINKVDSGTHNNAITIGNGVLEGIGTPGVPVANSWVAVQGLEADRPATGSFVGQLYLATDTGQLSRWTGTEWAIGSDITSTAQITFGQPAPFEIQANSEGATTTDLTATSRSITVFKGDTVQTSGVTAGTPTASPSAAITAAATVTGGVVKVTLSKADAQGSVVVPVTFGGVTYNQTIVVNRNTAAAPSGGGAGPDPFSDEVWSAISTASFVQVTDAGAQVQSNASGELRFSASSSYNSSAPGVSIAVIAAEVSLDETTWTNRTAETTGSAPINQPGEEEAGFVAFSGTTITGLTPMTNYYVRLIAKRTAGTGNISWFQSNFTARQP